MDYKGYGAVNKSRFVVTIVAALAILAGMWYVFSTKPKTEETTPTLKVGVTSGPHAQILEKVRELALKHNIHVDIVEFNDFILPNEALHSGELDLNIFQHEPFLDSQIQSRGYKLKSLGKSVLMPMGIYSAKFQKVELIPNESKIIIPNDPSNGARALLLLEKTGLIKLKMDATNGALLSVQDIEDNPRKLKIIELDAPQVPRAMDDAAAAVINTDWAVVSKIDPKTRIFSEDKDSPYVNVIVGKEDNYKQTMIEKFIALYQSPEAKDYIQEAFAGMVLPGW
jgi:D-methionine transport system substrate-binding protein